MDFRWEIVGGGPLLAELKGLARECSLAGYVSFSGEARHESLAALYRSGDCFLLGSRHEAQCMAALEAMACGLPWISPPVGALVDCSHLEPGEDPSGLLVRERNPNALADALERMIELPVGMRQQMGEAARRRVERDYALPVQAARLLASVGKLTSGAEVV